jgi:O-antigen ligase
MGHKSYFSDYEPVTRSRRSSRAARLWESDATTTAAAAEDEPWIAPRVAPSKNETQESVEPRATHGSAPRRKRETWLLKNGHTLSYAGLFLYTIAVFFRPYELSDSLAWSINISFWFAIFTLAVYAPTQLSLDGNLTVRTKEVNLLFLLTGVVLVSMVLGASPGESWAYFSETYIKIIIMFIVMVNIVRTEWRLKGLFWLTIAAGCISSVGAINDHRAGNFTVEGYRVMGKIGVYGMFGNPDDMSLHLITMIPIAVALMFCTRNLFIKLLYGGCALLMLAGTIFSFSRGCFLGLLTVAVVLGWKFGRRNRTVVFVLLFLGILGVLALAPGYFMTRLKSIFDHSLDPNGSAGARQDMVIHSIVVALRHPLLGVGMGAFRLGSAKNLGTHNAYTQVASELGLPALAMYVWFMVYPLRRLYHVERETYAQRRSTRFYNLSVGLQASLVGYMVASTFYTVAFYWNIYYLVAFAICLRRMYESERGLKAREGTGVEAEKIVDTDRGRVALAALDERQLT